MRTLVITVFGLMLVMAISREQLQDPRTHKPYPGAISAFCARLSILLIILAGLLLSPLLFGIARDYGWIDTYWHFFGFSKNPLR